MLKKGFTLIELLIVIAIILILISIALPNFLEAQIRAKITNAQAEMRSIEPAIASYLQDWKRYPRDGFELPSFPGTYPEENPRIWVQLTTPIKYFSHIPYDEFHVALKDTNGTQRSDKNKTYRYYGAWWRCLALGGNPAKNSEKCSKAEAERDFVGKWVIYSPGPDQTHNFGEWAMYRPYLRDGRFTYSPTNGTTSIGDLIRWGS